MLVKKLSKCKYISGCLSLARFKGTDKEQSKKQEAILTPKEAKQKAIGMFAKSPEQFYPTRYFDSIGFTRHQCKSCKKHFWAKSNRPVSICGDSTCKGKYTFINNPEIKRAFPNGLSYADAWNTFRTSLTNARVPCTAIPPYPTVARWRDDVDFVAAGIYCFQPYCVTGEAQPPANPLICPQFCVRFNDLENVGLTGRHYSGFVMLGIQAFNYNHKKQFWTEECVEFNYNWLKNGLKIPDDEITFTEDAWAGGGNLGPSIEYFVHGMEIGNMVFMQFATNADGSLEELKTQVIDTGIGLERVAWLANGSLTSYECVFRKAAEYLANIVGVSIKGNEEIWAKLAPYACQLDVEETEASEIAWQQISRDIGMNKNEIMDKISPLKDFFTVLDHTRTAMILIKDGMIPSNIGGGYNLRNLMRRALNILRKNGWWDALKEDGLLELMKRHIADLEGIYSVFTIKDSMIRIVKFELQKWLKTDEEQLKQLKKFTANKKSLTLDDWYTASTSLGLPIDDVSKATGFPVPETLYGYIEQKKQRSVKQKEKFWDDMSNLPETLCLYFDHLIHRNTIKSEAEFEAKVIGIYQEKAHGERNIIILDQTLFYPTSGGQEHDTGLLTFENGNSLKIVKVEKNGGYILHFLHRGLTLDEQAYLRQHSHVRGEIDIKRRYQLRNHHTATHIVFGACRTMLGDHVWQNGAKKTEENAHLDISHYAPLTNQQLTEIEQIANRIVLDSVKIDKTIMPKEQAERAHGFNLYQGGAIPGNELRVVKIGNFDVEACCGTHCDNTSQVGYIKIKHASRISDGIVRITYSAGERAIQDARSDSNILKDVCDIWSVPRDKIADECNQKFKELKVARNDLKRLHNQLLETQINSACQNTESKPAIIEVSDPQNPSFYFASIDKFANQIVKSQKSVILHGSNFACGILVDPKHQSTLEKLSKEHPSFQKVSIRLKSTQDSTTQKTFIFSLVNSQYIDDLLNKMRE